MYMGDDDTFKSENVPDYLNFLNQNLEVGYILRRYSIIHINNKKEDFRYLTRINFSTPGLNLC